MKRRIFLVVAILLILGGITILAKVVAGIAVPRGQGGLQVTASVDSEVFLNNKSIGKIPVCLCDQGETIASGEYLVKIVPKERTLEPFTAKVTVNPNVLTALDRVFLPGALSSSSILTLDKTGDSEAQIFISSIPDGALITIDGQSQGVTPLDLKSISASEHEVEIEKTGFAKKTVRIRAVAGYKLVLNAILGTQGTGDEVAINSPTPPTTVSTTPPPGQTPAPKNSVLILSTPTGFLRVRADSSISSAEVGRVNPGESYEYIDENDSWFEIKLTNGTKGWVSKTYTKKN